MKKIFVRFKGGGGGETFSWFLDETFNSDTNSLQTIQNRRIHHDVFGFLQIPVIPENMFPGQTGIFWDNVPVDILKSRFDTRLSQYNKEYAIGKGHHSVMSKKRWEKIFLDWYMIDILPNPKQFKFIQTLQFYKSAFKPIYVFDEYIIQRFNRHPQFNEASDFFNKHGWMPEYWIWTMGHEPYASIYDLEHFFKQHTRTIKVYNQQTWKSDLRIDAVSLITNIELVEFYKTLETFNVDMKPYLIPELKDWVNKNLCIFDDLGILDKVQTGYQMDREKTYDFFYQLFWDKANRLANGDLS